MKMSPETAQELQTLYANYFAVPERTQEERAQVESPVQDEVNSAAEEVKERLSINADRRFVQMLFGLNNPAITALVVEAYQAYAEGYNVPRMPEEFVEPAIMQLFEVARQAIIPDELDNVYDKTRAWEFMGYLEDLIEESAPPTSDEPTR